MRKKTGIHSPMYINAESPIGSDLNFVASEAYKLLRTNLTFSLPDEKKCRVIGITSSIRGEGKSTTAMNLAYALAETEKKVLLMELDMRLPTVAKRLSVASKPGVSNFLVGLNKVAEVLQKSGIHDYLYVMTAGVIPPNPSELLASKEMMMTINAMKESFDYIILDLPPVNVVSDALIVSKLTDGMIMVVRQNFINQQELNEAMRQLQIVDAKILGFVVNDGDTQGEKYKSKKYKKYGYEYGYGYDHKAK